MQFWQTKKFKTLSIVWEKKLEDSGFSDHEVIKGDDRVLKQRATNSYREAPFLERQTRLEYYCLLGHLANNELFPNELEKLVMLKHADGHSITEIVNEAQRKKLSVFRHTVRYIIRRWHMRWGVKYWTLKQMNLRKITE